MTFLAQSTNKLSTNTLWVLFAIAIALLVMAIVATWFFIRFKNAKKNAKDSFEVVTGIFKIFRFWQFYVIVIVALVGYVGAIVLLAVSLPPLISNS
ncbi:hypothetical protein SGLAD_v1c05780 [Spiroplasma gladiatoris]|uniref:Uncharacterized protein n=1 Tax=Spiroplasma gladiatoris TaxID=2143 RepID=A0A4P7AHR9_9MOLU|nr:hypothetical protein [Spiroplasma gladiatoris]QBQ07777.1 hypothetical protein SGLAD_v1c05780 [Spiroplasma gladiatoris]